MIKSKSIFVAIIFFSFSISLWAQETGGNLKWSERIKATDIRTLGVSDEYLIIQDGFDMPNIIILDKVHFKEVNKVEKFKPQLDGKNLMFLKGIVFQNKLIITVYKKNRQYIQRYSIPQLELENTIEIGEVEAFLEFSNPNGQFFAASIKVPKPNVQFLMSENKENLWVLYDNSGPEKKQKVEYVYQTFTKTFTGTRANIDLGIKPGYYSRLNAIITNDGKPFIFYKKSMDGKPSYYIYDVFKKKSFNSNLSFTLVNQKIIEHNNSIMLAGFCYRNKSFELYSMIYNPLKSQFESPIFTTFELSKTLEYADKSTIKKANKDVYSQPVLKYSVDGIKLLDDGSKYIYGEYYSTVIIMKSTAYVEHTTKEIYAAYIDKNGKLLSFTIIPKWQAFSNAVYSNPAWGSYLCFMKEDKLHFIFEDNPKNNNSDLHQKHYEIEDNADQTTLCILSKDGKVQRSTWLDNKELDIYPCPFLSIDLGNGEYIIGSYLKSKFKFALLKY